jgi:heme a synthase
MQQQQRSSWLHAYAMFTALATLFLICLGGLVTSHEAGLAVPDWPTTFGYNMFFFPISKWVGGIFYEHTHRLVASGVGLLTVIFAVWLWLKEPRAWVRRLGLLAVFLVILQGVLGGIRVTALKDEIGIFHGALAQLFFVLMCALALFTSKWWIEERPLGARHSDVASSITLTVSRVFLAVTLLMFGQLIIGATMRHEHAGLAISDFPLAYGSVWPDTSPDAVLRYNQMRGEVSGLKEITAPQIYLQMAHRFTALVLFVAVGLVARHCWKRFGSRNPLARLALGWFGLVVAQAALGAATIWTNKSADIATAHVALGAVSLATGALLTIITQREAGQASCLSAIPRNADTPVRAPLVARHSNVAA